MYRDTHANYPPTSADNNVIGAGTKIGTTASNKAEDTNLSDWADVDVDAGDLIDVAVITNDNAMRMSLFVTFVPR
jgi:hypothetical protein